MSDMLIRKADKADIQSIYGLVKELAIFEKEPDALTIGIIEYLEAFQEGLIDSIVAVNGKEIIGIALFYMTFSTWKGKCLYLEDFYIKPEYRREGLGQRLFDALLEEAKVRKATQVKWQVLDWNETGLNFYYKNNAIIEKNWWNGKLYLT
ncbi:MAG: GNAT family N-acetyltransferase [Saprospiraceae bacterium]|nr:GNAT family N-acetyltransferase [Saprospiraceae bacterium]